VKIVGAFVLIAAMALVWFFILRQPEGAKVARSDGDFAVISNAIKIYIINAGRPPTTAQGLEAFVNEPRTGPKPRRWTQVMKKVPTDPWSTPYRYTLLEPKDRCWCWELRSAGPDGFFGSGDDFVAEDSGGIVVPDAAQAGEDGEPRLSF
jgi:general secretion pathway protein G